MSTACRIWSLGAHSARMAARALTTTPPPANEPQPCRLCSGGERAHPSALIDVRNWGARSLRAWARHESWCPPPAAHICIILNSGSLVHIGVFLHRGAHSGFPGRLRLSKSNPAVQRHREYTLRRSMVLATQRCAHDGALVNTAKSELEHVGASRSDGAWRRGSACDG